MSDSNAPSVTFRDLNLSKELLQGLDEVGYETPSPIQAQAIPHLMQGLDILGHAPTGTGKTAAFALPLLSRLDLNNKSVQVMALAPTRELAVQVAEAFKRYAKHIPGFNVLAIYGGQDYSGQIRQLKRGVHVVVGTPGRVMDHMRKGTLKLDGLQALVLDEADEMLRMGFVDEVEWILEQTPPKRQMALFSATMPKEIQRIARRHLEDPQEVSIKAKTATAETIRQRYWLVSGLRKLEALTRILEVEDFDGILIFVRTKLATSELAEQLEARGHAAAAMNGDMAQKSREQMVARLKSGSLDILVATDVAARGLDVDRISHVINYDIPYDTEAYIHRIGRTGRAGRKGDAILFVAPRERRMLGAIERATRQKITELELPSTETVNKKRIADFKQKITDTIAKGHLAFMRGIIEEYQSETEASAMDIAAAMANISQGDQTLLMAPEKKQPNKPRNDNRDSLEPRNNRGRQRERAPRAERTERGNRPERSERSSGGSRDMDLELFRIEVGREHGVEPSNIVGAIANEAGLDARNIGHISINDNFSMVELPAGMPKDVFGDLRKVWVCGQQLRISRDGEGPSGPIKDGRPPRAESKPRRKGPQGDDVKSEKKRAPKSRSKANSAEARPGSPEAKKKPAKRTPKPVDSDS
ncbi:MAG: ATP-dependent RNA helicase DeaD [Candidatus Azotimanducaceae bacterium]|jgi:ATP-dependent RNA helicase DeaD|tara:strand:+ start:3458 stop:5392 length:1935 start_codon:yes stop_codon:yes gene_type:complete